MGKQLARLLDKKDIAVFGATTSGEFIDGDIEEGSITIMLLDMNPEYFKLIISWKLEIKLLLKMPNKWVFKEKTLITNPAFIIASGWLSQ